MSVIIVPAIFGVPSAVVAIHVPGPVDIAVGWIVQYMIIVRVSIMVIVKFNLFGWIGILMVMTSVITLLGVFILPIIPVPVVVNIHLCFNGLVPGRETAISV